MSWLERETSSEHLTFSLFIDLPPFPLFRRFCMLFGWSVRRRGHGMRNMILSILKGFGMALGVILLALGGYMGIENIQAPKTINFTIFIFSVAAILVGSFMLWLVFKKKENM